MTSLSPVERWPCLTSAWLLRQGRGFVFMFFKRSKRRYFDQAFVKLCVNGAAGVQGLQVQLGSVFGSMIGQPSFSVRVWRCDISRISPMSLNVFFLDPEYLILKAIEPIAILCLLPKVLILKRRNWKPTRPLAILKQLAVSPGEKTRGKWVMES